MFIYETITIKTDKLRGAYKYTCYFILKQLILNYEIFWHNYRYGEGNTISFGYDKAEMLRGYDKAEMLRALD